ncbi:hypothetical protein SAMN06295879_3014 [Agreia bicolorata]|uniref:Uncharacterized protein n=1 Tax=Agreia bicolorata TaxID=110935 RepID=A0A1T4YGU1_9MICO|nr:hypothetical protein [Agreia bicolorata]SKB00455.1 hypothetical protein SAMN06295879_3014 [Agreia bicolorata]
MEKDPMERRLVSPSRRIAIFGLILSLVTLIGSTVSIIQILAISTPYTGAAIDDFDANELDASGLEVLGRYAAAVLWINVAGTVLGVAALVIAVRSRKSGWVWIPTIVAALLAPLVCFVPSLWMFAAAY